MAFKDRIDKLISYFDTDDVSEIEEGVEQPTPSPSRQVTPQRPEEKPQPLPHQVASELGQPHQRAQVSPPRPSRPTSESSRQDYRSPRSPHPQQPSARPIQEQTASRPQAPLAGSQGTEATKIALKYPRRYEDAPAIVDLLIQNECVLIDFEYMLEAQARRCLDFIDGASKVLYGSLQKVGSSMYLLAPANVVVDIEEIITPTASQDISYDYDMKRR